MSSSQTHRATIDGHTLTLAVYQSGDGTWWASAIGARWFGKGTTEAEAVQAFCNIANSAEHLLHEQGNHWEPPTRDV